MAPAPDYRPLQGMRVLDLARLIPGDLATRKLAELGADVVKFEAPPHGDYLRANPPFHDGRSIKHLLLNRGKRSVIGDVRTPEGLALFNRLVAHADALIEVSVPGAWRRAGLDLSELRRRHPRLVICSITAFGLEGSLAQLPAHGMSMDALAGVAPVVADPGGRLRFGYLAITSFANESAAANAALAVTAAVTHARATGEGQWIDISCWDSAADLSRMEIAYLSAGTDQRAEEAADTPFYAIYEAADGQQVVLCAIEARFWKRFCDGVSRPDLFDEWQPEPGSVAAFGTPRARKELEALFKTAEGRQWLQRLLDWQVPGGLVVQPRDLPSLDHARSRQLYWTDPSDGLRYTRSPIRWSTGARPGQDDRAAPELGADSELVVREWCGDEDGTG
jgi:crotonobetainyl-CoA:carnitine CoA-transferase CaiB-like acyl-CoA transferase